MVERCTTRTRLVSIEQRHVGKGGASGNRSLLGEGSGHIAGTGSPSQRSGQMPDAILS